MKTFTINIFQLTTERHCFQSPLLSGRLIDHRNTDVFGNQTYSRRICLVHTISKCRNGMASRDKIRLSQHSDLKRILFNYTVVVIY